MASALVVGTAFAPQPAEAKYSDYTRREADWDERMKKGEIKVSTAKDLRTQLAEIVPQNSEGSKIFCPNGASAAVSPLMENKCSDTLMALPSVYGRSTDVMGNSIPGRINPSDRPMTGSRPQVGSASLTATPNVGGFPKY